MRTVDVNLGDNSYSIYIGRGLLAQAQLIQRALPTRQIAVITNQVVADYYLPVLLDSLRQGRDQATIQIETIILPEGEQHKNQTTLNSIYDRLIEKRFSRDCMLVALGGGIVGDIAGFAAASYQRGVNFIQIPTTVLAQVDSSVGGKTGINHRLGKNLIGAFYQPKAVFIDTDVLKTLPVREIAAGMAEVIKYGLIRDRAFLQRLDDVLDEVMALNDDYWAEIIQISCQHKANVVENDEKEKGERATLNLGHTFGHAIEALTSYRVYLHGEAVAIGTMMAAELSKQLGWLNADDVALMDALFRRAHCPVDVADLDPPLSAGDIRAAMQRDKKVAAGKLKLILLKTLGQAVIRNDIDESEIVKAIDARL
ncbi:MAG: 3-dehydroquinate synthase [Gammaproteobacteria bacterium]|nr:MAG: 3-dehydroquinate synthase [Gammaproteobacteria bacterium]